MTQDEALKILKTGVSVFLTGEPGSGKSHTVNRYVEYLRSHNIEPAITASTGIAATHINGMTIHSWSGIGIKKELSSWDLGHILEKEYLVKRIRNTKVLLIDEVSMIDANTLQLVDKVCRIINHTEERFGGIQVVLVGDFFQLPPIARNGEDVQFAFESQVWEDLGLTVCYLSEQHRQEDSVFLSLLSAIRVGEFEEEHFEHIQKRIGSHNNIPKDVTKLFSHNADVDRINSNELATLPGETYFFSMKHKGKSNLIETLKRGCLSQEELALKKGATVMFTKNNQREGFVNGTLGTVIGFDEKNEYPIVQKRNGKKIAVEPTDWSIEENGKVKASVTQIPLRLAWAITIHKSQGMSLDSAVMDLSMAFEYGQGYVALSRVRELKGLYLLGVNETAFLVHPKVLEKNTEFLVSSNNVTQGLETISKNDLKQKHDQFLIVCGGTLEEVSPKKEKIKVSTQDTTLELLKMGFSLENIARERELTEGTIIGHLESLLEKNIIEESQVTCLFDKSLNKSLPVITKAFLELKTTSLTPVFANLKGRYTFNELRLARMTLKKVAN